MRSHATATLRLFCATAAFVGLTSVTAAMPLTANAAPPVPDDRWVSPEVCPDFTLPDPATIAPGNTFTVTSDEDSGDASVAGTLRWALAQADLTQDEDTVVIAGGVNVQVTDVIDVQYPVVIRGAEESSSITNVGSDDLFFFRSWDDVPGFLVLDGLTLVGAAPAASGIEIMDRFCSVQINNTTVRDFADTGVSLSGMDVDFLRITGSTFSGVSASSDSFRAALTLGHDHAATDVLIDNTVFEDNPAGGALFSGFAMRSEQSITVRNSVFRGNGAAVEPELTNGAGGLTLTAMNVAVERTAPIARVENTLFENNQGMQSGALTFDEFYDHTGESDLTGLVVTDSTFSGNRVLDNEDPPEELAGEQATGILLGSALSGNPDRAFTLLSASNVTFDTGSGQSPEVAAVAGREIEAGIFFDHATFSGAGLTLLGLEEDASVALTNTVFDTGDRTPVMIREGAEEESDPEYRPTLTDSHSAFSAEPEQLEALDTRIVAASAQLALGALDPTLGQTPVRVPQPESVLIDAAGPGGPALDQRGLARPQGSAPDIGAVEAEVSPEPALPGSVAIGDDQTVPAGTSAAFTVTRQAAAEARGAQGFRADEAGVSVRVQTVDGTAVAGSDYTAVSEVLTWADGDTDPKTVTVPTAPSMKTDRTVQFTVALSDPDPAELEITRSSATGTITDRFVDPGESDADADADGSSDGDGDVDGGHADTTDADVTDEPTPTATKTPGRTPLAETGAQPAGPVIVLGAAALVALGGAVLLARRARRA